MDNVLIKWKNIDLILFMLGAITYTTFLLRLEERNYLLRSKANDSER